jgi:hypothetical protein
MKIIALLLGIGIFAAVCVLSLSCCGDAGKPDFTHYLDHPAIEKVSMPEDDFLHSAFNLEGIISSSIASKEVPGATAIAKEIRVLLATHKEGVSSLDAASISFGELLKKFAGKWNVAVLVHGNTILIVDPSDASRFENDVTLMP